MTEYHTIYKGPEGATTEWDDLQRKHGNLPAKEAVWKPDAFAPEEEAGKDEAVLDTKDAQELEDMEDEFADDRFLEEYRRRRIDELKRGAARPRFGSFEPISGPDFVAQVTNAGDGVWVVCHLYKDAVPDCGILNACLKELAVRYPSSKFVKIVATDCIAGFPDENLPTVLLYHNGKCVTTVVGLKPLGGQGTSPDRVAMALNVHGAVCGDPEEEAAAQVKGVVGALIEERARQQEEADDEDSDFDN